MTKAFDDKARKEMIEQFNAEEFRYNDIPIREMEVREISIKTARHYISTFHYSKTLPDSTLYAYAGYLGERLCGIVTYGMGAGKNQYTSVIPDIQNGQYAELTRLWCVHDMPKNTESKLISTSLKMLPKNIKLVISFADSSKQHAGIIYQATNWYYLGKNGGGKVLVTNDGIVKHTRLLGIYKMRNPELKSKTNEEIMKIYGWKYEEAGSKHRYVYLRGSKREKKKMYKMIEERIQPYPKVDKTQRKNEEEIIEQEKERIKGEQLNLFI